MIEVREAIRAGSWYSGNKEGLTREIKAMFLHKIGPGRLPSPIDKRKNNKQILGLVSPHAGYACSAPTASHGYLALAEDRKEIDTVIILGNNHTGMGPDISVGAYESWKTPLGKITVNERLAALIIRNVEKLPAQLAKEVAFDTAAHQSEHSIEIQLPFLQFIFQDFDILPIAIDRIPVDMADAFGKYLADLIIEQDLSNSAVLIASSDMSHGNYFPQLSHDQVSALDKYALEPLLRRDIFGLEQAIKERHVSMCGVSPVEVLLSCTNKLGAKEAKLLNYATSGLTCGPKSAVVGYASVVISR